MEKEIVESNNQVVLAEKQDFFYFEYQLASLWKIFFVRLFDFILISLPFLIMGFMLKPSPNDWFFLLLNYSVGLIVNFTYFILLPCFLKGRTLGKFLFNIKLIKNDKISKISFLDVFLREMWMLIGPWTVFVIFKILFLFFAYKTDQTSNQTFLTFGFFIDQISTLVFILWISLLGVSIRLQKNHQCYVDLKRKLLVVHGTPKNQPHEKPQEKTNLKTQPGFIDIKTLQNLSSESKSINLEKKDMIKGLKQGSNKNKRIDRKDLDDK